MAKRAEPEKFDSSKYHEDCVKILREKQWLPFLEKFNGNNEEVTKQFAVSFNGEKDLIGNRSFRISEDTIAQSINISPEGGKYFKTKQFKEKSWTQFMSRSRVSSVNWKNGVPRSWLLHPWDEMVYILQKFVTCEGRYSIVFLYHIKILLHLKGQCTISLPYFLLQSLTKMSKTIQKQKGNEDKSLCHFGLIKILIESELQRRGITWEGFLISNKIKTKEDEQGKQGSTEFMVDMDGINKETPVFRLSIVAQPSSSVKTRRMRQEDAKKIAKDKIFTSYTRRSRRVKGKKLQDDQPEQDINIPIEIESSDDLQPEQDAEMETDNNRKERKEPALSNRKQRELEKQIQDLKEELMEVDMLEKVIKKENKALRAQNRKIQCKNEKLKRKVKELKTDQIELCKWATKYTQKKALKEKYKNMKNEFQAQMNVDVLLQAAKAGYRGSTSGWHEDMPNH
jgi:hypothetical protein